jgi:MFS family permease
VAARWVLGGLGIGMAASVLLILTVSLAWPFALVAALGVALGATVIGWNGVFLAETARLSPEGQVSEATAGVMVVTFMGSVIGPPLLSGLLALTESYEAGFLLLTIAALAMGLVFFLPERPKPQS